MKPRVFNYISARSLDEVFDALAQHGDEARILAGGQSLVPMMNLRLASPSVIVDINDCAGLGGIAEASGRVRIGALTRHRETEHSVTIRTSVPLLAQAMPHVAHLAIRNRGTIGGSVALADPAAELPACALALDATIELGSRRGTRRIAAADFFQGLYATAIEPDEAVVALEFPVTQPSERCAFLELSRRHGDFAVAGIAARATPNDGRLTDVTVVGFGIADRPVRLGAVERLLAEGDISLDAVKRAVSQDAELRSDNQYSVEAKAHLAAELIRRVVYRLSGTGGAERTHG